VKKLRKYIISLFALLTWTTYSWGCGTWECPPGEYMLFRVFDKAAKYATGREVTQLPESDHPEVRRYLELARSCSNIRSQYNSKWYYPTKGEDVVVSSLEEVLEESLAYKGGKLKDRYALQAARAMFTLGQFNKMIEWWSITESTLDDDSIRKSIEGYVAGALFRTGKQEKALKYYTEIGDISSIIYCLKKMGNYEGDRSILEYAAVNCPDNPYILEILQEYVSRLELYGVFSENHGLTDAFFDLCMRAVRHSNDPAPWLYTASFLKNQMGQPYVALNILERAEKCNASTFLKESIRVLRILIEAQIYPCNKAYESKLLNDLKWLDNKIQSNITERVKEETASIYSLKFCHSYYYWNDMMRRLILGTVCPRMIEAGKAPLALLLANYADNRLMMAVNQIEIYGEEGQTCFIGLDEYRKSPKYFNSFDFSNHYFRMLDTALLNYLIQYESLLKSPSTEIERFLQARSYVDSDYLMDIIGTRYIRELKYSKAVEYLSKVSDGYQKRLNTSVYMDFDPFEIKTHNVKTSSTYKLNFARKMVNYENSVQNGTDDDIKGEALINMGLGIRSSFMSCWALTHYSKSEYNPWFEDKYTLDKIAYANSLMEQGLAILKDPELAARYHQSLCQWRTAVEKFPETSVAEEIRTSCDNIVNYSYNPPKVRDTGEYVNLYCW
jgi:tetratricopeptide (TPR) repeat protein